jgi:HlyD family secretion protein
MTGSNAPHRRVLFCIGYALVVACGLAGCNGPDRNQVQGYVEGEYVYVASPLAGALESLHVKRGTSVRAGDVLFILESAAEKAARSEADRRLAQGRATLEDAIKGKRPSEIASIEAQLQQAQAALRLSEIELARQEKLFRAHAGAAQDLDRARSTRDQDRQRVAQVEADLKTARLGSRSHQIVAAGANVRALEATLARAEWDLSQKRQVAAQDGLVFDTLYREGEWVAAGRPVVALLPPQNIKVRAFVSETRLGAIHLNDKVKVTVDGSKAPFFGKVSFISPQVEYTPPVIYSKESRDKLVFMIEAVFDPKTAESLHPGQPVDVEFGF